MNKKCPQIQDKVAKMPLYNETKLNMMVTIKVNNENDGGITFRCAHIALKIYLYTALIITSMYDWFCCTYECNGHPVTTVEEIC